MPANEQGLADHISIWGRRRIILKWPNCELNMQEIRQQIGSAFRSPPEHVVSRVVTSEIDPLQPFVKTRRLER